MSKSLPAATAFVQTKAGELRIFIQSGAVQQTVRGWFGRGKDIAKSRGLTYHERVFKQTDKYHRIPKSIENEILKTTPKVRKSDGSLQYKLRGKINGETGTYEIGVNPRSNEIFHRFFDKD